MTRQPCHPRCHDGPWYVVFPIQIGHYRLVTDMTYAHKHCAQARAAIDTEDHPEGLPAKAMHYTDWLDYVRQGLAE